jgi:hypothetical protein
MPDLAVLLPTLFGDVLGARLARGPVRETVRRAGPAFIAVQIAAEFGADHTLDGLAWALRRVPTGLGIVLVVAGTAPWHDDARVLDRLAGRLGTRAVRLASTAAWDVAALLSCSRAVVSSSLHVALVATAFGVPAIGLVASARPGVVTKLAAVAATWHAPDELRVVNLDDLAGALAAAIAGGPGRQVVAARRRAQACRDGFAALMRRLDNAA